MTSRSAHPRPEAMAIAACRAEGTCKCWDRAMRSGRQPWHLINRRLCEHRYKAAVAEIIRNVMETTKR